MKTEEEKMIAGEMHNSLDEVLVKERDHACCMTSMFNNMIETEQEKRGELLKKPFGSIREQLYIEPTFRCGYDYNILCWRQCFCGIRFCCNKKRPSKCRCRRGSRQNNKTNRIK